MHRVILRIPVNSLEWNTKKTTTNIQKTKKRNSKGKTEETTNNMGHLTTAWLMITLNVNGESTAKWQRF